MLLPAVMTALASAKTTPVDMAQAQALLAVLSASDPGEITKLLTEAQAAGLNLAQVGAVALMADRRDICRVLLSNFSVRIENYLTFPGQEANHRQKDYPLLAALCAKGDDAMMQRALAWGAAPGATWEVARPFHHYNPTQPMVISWVAEAIASLQAPTVKRLLKKCGPPDNDEQDRRLRALWDASWKVAHMAGDEHDPKGFARLREMIELFGPGGAHAVTRTPWDVDGKDTSLGVAMALDLPWVGHGNHSAGSHQARALFMPWLRVTATAEDCVSVLEHKLTHSPTNKEPLPAWCVEKIDARQANALLHVAWDHLLRRLLVVGNAPANKQLVLGQLQSSGEVWAVLTQKALQVEGQTGFEQVLPSLGQLPLDQFATLTAGTLTAIAEHWPNPGRNRQALMEECWPLRDALMRRKKNANTSPETMGAVDEVSALHGQLVLQAHNADSVPVVARSTVRM